MTTASYYKEKIDNLKAQFESNHPVFADGKDFEEIVRDGAKWKQFKDDKRLDELKKVG